MNHCMAYDRCGPSSRSGAGTGVGSVSPTGGVDSIRSRYTGATLPPNCGASRSISIRRISVSGPSAASVSWAGLALLGGPDATDHLDGAVRRCRRVDREGNEAAVDQHHAVAAVELETGDDVVAGAAALGAVEHQDLVVDPGALDTHDAPLCGVGVEVGFGQQLVERYDRFVAARFDVGVERLALIETIELPHPEVDHQHDAEDHDRVKRNPPRPEEEAVRDPIGGVGGRGRHDEYDGIGPWGYGPSDGGGIRRDRGDV